MITKKTREKILLKRKICEYCRSSQATELHHCIVHRSINKPELDSEENLMPVCHKCHMNGEINTRETKISFWNAQIKRGYNMQEWYDNLNLKYKEFYYG